MEHRTAVLAQDADSDIPYSVAHTAQEGGVDSLGCSTLEAPDQGSVGLVVGKVACRTTLLLLFG